MSICINKGVFFFFIFLIALYGSYLITNISSVKASLIWMSRGSRGILFLTLVWIILDARTPARTCFATRMLNLEDISRSIGKRCAGHCPIRSGHNGKFIVFNQSVDYSHGGNSNNSQQTIGCWIMPGPKQCVCFFNPGQYAGQNNFCRL